MALDKIRNNLERAGICFYGRARFCFWACFLIGMVFPLQAGAQNADKSGLSAITLTNASQVRKLAGRKEGTNISVRLQGTALWISAKKDQLIFQDETGGIFVKMDCRDQEPVQLGQKILLEGNCSVDGGTIMSTALIENDGIHAQTQKAGTVFLSAGPQPFRVEYFNNLSDFVLKLDWMGPGFQRRPVPSAALFRSAENGTNNLAPGMDYRCYEGDWQRLPEFAYLQPRKRGIARDFDLGILSRTTNVAAVFSGFLTIPKDGMYTFWLSSDDGSLFSIGGPPLRLSVLGDGSWPMPLTIFPGQLVPEDKEYQWAEVEGTVTRVTEVFDGICLELTSGMGRTSLNVKDRIHGPLDLLLQSRIRAGGICQNSCTVDGQKIPSFLVPDFKQITVLEIAPTSWADHPMGVITPSPSEGGPLSSNSVVHVRGRVGSDNNGKSIFLEDSTGRALLDGAQPLPLAGDQIEVLGWKDANGSNTVLKTGFYRKITLRENSSLALPLLTKAIQVMSLNRTQAQRGYPAKLGGIITARIINDYVIQDSTWSVYLKWGDVGNRELPNIGEYWEIEGRTSIEFAPDIQVSRAKYVGPGVLPEPIRPSGTELINGSLDTKYAEVQGVAISVESSILTLLTSGRLIRFVIKEPEPMLTKGLEGSLIYLRGVCSPERDRDQKFLPSLGIYNPSISVIESAPSDLFSIPLKHAGDFKFFDAHADALHRVRVGGQVLHARDGEYYLMDGDNGLRCVPSTPVEAIVGDLVEVVGFPEVSGPSPLLRYARVRKMGRAELPAPRQVSENTLLSGSHDAVLVRLVARLVSMTSDPSEQVLQLQSENRGYVARLRADKGRLSGLLPGSRLELAGVYSGKGGDRSASREIDSFELLLNSPLDIRILERPSWWTIQHSLTVAGGLMFIVLVALVWIALLRRQVEDRSMQLTEEVRRREQIERQRALEQERARIAQDLHDDLGAALTQIRFLSAVESRDETVPESTRNQLKQVSEKSRSMVTSLDEIVWAVNPANDSLPSLALYLRHIAQEFFRTTEILCLLDVDDSLPSIALTSEVRHNVYLVVREALNNVAKHSRATEVWLRIHWKEKTLHIVVEDNGCGFDKSGVFEGDGLRNMQLRLEKVGGRFECESRVGSGTVCRFYLAFP